jgi:hypothetical protein
MFPPYARAGECDFLSPRKILKVRKEAPQV